jgi:putative membrane-bound dehydrogenase-like protein
MIGQTRAAMLRIGPIAVGLLMAGCLIEATAAGRAARGADAAGSGPEGASGAEAVSPHLRRPMVDGLPAADAAAHMTVPPGFTVRLMAGEPDVRQPIAMAFDDRGRLWVAEAYSYPVRVADAEARDRILIFEDTDGDDVFDSRTVFVEGLNLVSGLELGFGGVWVGAAPYLLYFPDRDGDDRPDGEPEVVLDGWGHQDTHETLNAFTWGPDGWLYGCHGVFTHSAVGRPGTADGDRVKLNAGIWRYHPVRRSFEVFAEGTSNPWGVDFNDLGDAFETACVIPHLYHVIQGARYQRQAGQHFNPWTFDDIKTIARHRHWTGGQWNQADREESDRVGGGHAHSGAMVYLGGAWPERYRGRLFMNNIHGARLNVDRLEPAGSGYAGDGDPDFLFANDTSSQFVALQYGPDGQVVLIDWYDRNQCHRREVEAHDRDTGRIFKVAFVGRDAAAPQPPRNLAALDDRPLVDLLGHDNDWFVRHARRLLHERAVVGRLDPDTPALLRERLAEATTAPKRLRIAWALHVIGALDEPVILALLRDAYPHVRGWGVQLACEPLAPASVASLSAAVRDRLVALSGEDPSPVVRRFLASAAGRIPHADRWEILAGLLAHGEDSADHNLPLLVWYALEPLVAADPSRAVRLSAAGRIPLVSRFVVRRMASEERFADPLVTAITAAPVSDRAWMLGEVATALAARGRAAMPPAWIPAYEALRRDPAAEVRRLADEVAARFGDQRVLPGLRAVVADPSADVPARGAAIESLVAARDPELPLTLHAVLSDGAVADPGGIALGKKVFAALASVPHERTPAVVLAAYGRLAAEDRQAAIATLTSRPAWTLALLDAIERGDVPRGDLSTFTVGRLAESADGRVLERLAEVWGTVRPTPADRREEFDRWRRILDRKALAAADLPHGRAVFAKTCGTCHVLHGEGARIGPELTGSNRADLEYLLSNLLDPGALVGRDYQLTQILTHDGRVLGGIVVAESPQAVTLQTPTERIVVPGEDIETRTLSEKSLMPENQLGQLDPASARDLVAYLQHAAQVPLPAEEGPPVATDGRPAAAGRGPPVTEESP